MGAFGARNERVLFGIVGRRAMTPSFSERAILVAIGSALLAGCPARSAPAAPPKPSAAAAPADGKRLCPSPAPSKSTDDTDPKLRASAAFEAGVICFNAGQFGRAADHFESSNAAAFHARTVYYLALSHDRIGSISLAVDYYEWFLRSSPNDAEQVTFAQNRVKQLRKLLPGGCTYSEKVGGVKCPPPQP